MNAATESKLFFLWKPDHGVAAWTPAPRLVVPTGHTEFGRCFAFSPDGRFLITTCGPIVVLWNRAGQELQRYYSDCDDIDVVRFSPDASRFLSVGRDARVRIWELNSHEGPRVIKNEGQVSDAAFSPDGQTLLLAGSSGRMQMHDLTGRKIGSFATGYESCTQAVAYSPDGRYLLAGDSDGRIILWDRKGVQLSNWLAHGRPVSWVEFPPEGAYFVTASGDGTAKLWRVDGMLLQVVECAAREGAPWAAQRGDEDNDPWDEFGPPDITARFSPDGMLLLIGGIDRDFMLWRRRPAGDNETGFQPYALDRMLPFDEDAIFSPDGQLVLAGSIDGPVRAWTFAGQVVERYEGCTVAINALAFSPDGRYLAAAGDDGTVKLWDAQRGLLEVLMGHSASLTSVAWSADGRYLATGSKDHSVRMWTVGTWAARVIEDVARIESVQFSPDSQLLVYGTNEGTVRVCDLSGRVLGNYHRGGLDDAWAIFSPDGRSLLTAVRDNVQIHPWPNPTNDHPRQLAEDARLAAFSPITPSDPAGGRYIALAGSEYGNAYLIDRNGAFVDMLRGHSKDVVSVVFSPDGQFVLTASLDHTARLWDPRGELVRKFCGHRQGVTSAVFSPDGRWVATASKDQTCRLWNVKTGQEVATLFAVNTDDWAVTTPDGRFDASAGALKRMHYVVGLETMDVAVLLKDDFRFGLLTEILKPEAVEAEGVAARTPFGVRIADNRLVIEHSEGDVQVFINGRAVDGGLEPGKMGNLRLPLVSFVDYFAEHAINWVEVRKA
jgi:WD40 repeat protein